MHQPPFLPNMLSASRRFMRSVVCINELERSVSAWRLFTLAVLLAGLSILGSIGVVLAEESGGAANAVDNNLQSAIASPEDIRLWVGELGHENYTVRQTAA